MSDQQRRSELLLLLLLLLLPWWLLSTLRTFFRPVLRRTYAQKSPRLDHNRRSLSKARRIVPRNKHKRRAEEEEILPPHKYKKPRFYRHRIRQCNSKSRRDLTSFATLHGVCVSVCKPTLITCPTEQN